MKRFPATVLLLILALLVIVFSAPGYAMTDKVILHIEGMT
jgi:hypothetical protein